MNRFWTTLMQATEKWGMAPDRVLSEAAKQAYVQSVFWFSVQMFLIAIVQIVGIGIVIFAARELRNPNSEYSDEDCWYTIGLVGLAWLVASLVLFGVAGDALAGIVSPELRVIQNSLPSA